MLLSKRAFQAIRTTVENYGIVGDMHSVALAGTDSSID